MASKEDKPDRRQARSRLRGGKKKYEKPELVKHGILSIVEGD